MTLRDSIEKAAEDLPHGYQIQLGVEKDAAWLDLICPDGVVRPLNDADLSLDDQVLAGIQTARLLSEEA